MVNIFKKKKRVLVLGGGGARGLAVLGALKVLEKEFDECPFDMVIGTSMGSLLGAAYCAGVPIKELENKIYNFNHKQLLKFKISSTGILNGKKLEEIIKSVIGDIKFQDLKIPFAVTTVNVSNGEELYHTSGDLLRLVRASCSCPGIFPAVAWRGKLLVDGGLRNNIPTKIAKIFEATSIIAINPGYCVSKHKPKNIAETIVQSLQIALEELNDYQAKEADVQIKPELENIAQTDFQKARYIVEQGEKAMEKVVNDIKKVVK